MARIITLKYAGKCTECERHLEVGERAYWHGRGRVRCINACTSGPLGVDDDDGSMAERRRDDHEYAMGRMEAERYLSDKAIYGAALADEWEMDAEMARYNRGEV